VIKTEDSVATYGYHVNVPSLVARGSLVGLVEIVAPMTKGGVATQSNFTHLDPLQIHCL